MPGQYIMCPSCGNTRNGARIYRCSKCAHVFCWDCKKNPGLLSNYVCPKCSKGGWNELGKIERQ